MKQYFLGLAANYSAKKTVAKHTFAVGRKSDVRNLEEFLSEKYNGRAILCKNGRSALALGLKAYFDKGDKILVNGFTCFAVFEAVKAAGLVPVFVDINLNDLNFDEAALKKLAPEAKGIIIQNTLGNPADIDFIEKIAKKHNLIIVEDLAHSAGAHYADGREAGTVGAFAAFSFGKEKVIDTISGGALVLRAPVKHEIEAPSRHAGFADAFRARFYPVLGTTARKLNHVHLSGVFMKTCLKLRLMEKSADNNLNISIKPSKFEAKLALPQFENLKKAKLPLREFYLVQDREKVLSELKKAGYYFDGFWYEVPVAPKRYYKKVRFPEAECPNAMFVANHIINLPTFYEGKDLARARKIIEPYIIKKESK